MGYTIGLAVGIALSTALSPLPVAHDAPRNISHHFKEPAKFAPKTCAVSMCRDA